jgi:hypothetical protein
MRRGPVLTCALGARRLALACALLLPVAAGATVAQTVITLPPRPDAQGALLRGLDTLNGSVADLSLALGETTRFGQLEITLDRCRTTGEEAMAYLRIRDVREDSPRFEGWMFASSPALSALDHPRYDVWVLSCSSS